MTDLLMKRTIVHVAMLAVVLAMAVFTVLRERR